MFSTAYMLSRNYHNNYVPAPAFNPPQSDTTDLLLCRHLAVGGNDAMLTIWDLTRMVCSHTLAQSQGAVKSISWSHDSEYVAYADDEHKCNFVKVDTGGCDRCVAMQDQVAS